MGLSIMLNKIYGGILRFIEILQDIQRQRAEAYVKYGRIAE